MKHLLTYLVIIVIALLLVACPSEENKNGNNSYKYVDTIDVPCVEGSTVQIWCDSALIPLSCSEGNEVSCGSKVYVAKPVTAPVSMIDTIPSPSNGSTFPQYHGMQLPVNVVRVANIPESHLASKLVDTIDVLVPCRAGNIVYIECGEEYIPLPCNEGSEVECPPFNYVAQVDTID